jgi:MFS family permease
MIDLTTEKENTSNDIVDGSPQEQYSVFTRWEKWCIVALVSFAAWFSTLSSFIYYPALQSLSEDLAVSVDEINLTITTYMAVATVAPTLVGDFADIFGRRPAYLVTLSVYIAANVAVALTRSFHALLGLRILQALAISGDRSNRSFETDVLILTRTRNLFYSVWRDYRYRIACRTGFICERSVFRVICVRI